MIINKIPEYIMKMPPEVGKAWLKVFQEAQKLYGGEQALIIANEWVRKRFIKNGDSYIGNSNDFVSIEFFTLELSPVDTEFVSNSPNGDIVLNAVLSDDKPWLNPSTGETLKYSPELLEDFANQINTNGLTLPDVDHEEYNDILSQYPNPEDAVTEFRKRKGILKDIKAIFKEGKLFISAKLDKRYKNHIEHFKGLSLETFAKKINDTYVHGKLLGFTFTNNPMNTRAKILK